MADASLDDTFPSGIAHIACATYPVRTGNFVRPLIDSGATFRRICEAIDAARHRVWVCITFLRVDFAMPDGRGTIFDVLERARLRGLDVRLLIWRPLPQSSGYGQAFGGNDDDRAWLAQRGSPLRIRWDVATGRFVQHQKCWLIDAGHEGETAFVGGINPTFAIPGTAHDETDRRHDLYVEIAGPSACDVHHNFVQRWNEASERHRPDGVWADDGVSTLAFPSRPGAVRGTSVVQIQRNMHAGRYCDATPAPDAHAFEIARGERTITDQYVQAIRAARHAIYLAHQALPVEEIAYELECALKRGVAVVLLEPIEPESDHVKWRSVADSKPFFDQIEALGRHANFLLAGIAALAPDGRRRAIYVHAKLMLIDDTWLTLGSCNVHANSLYGHGELNVTTWDAEVARALRVALLVAHLEVDTSSLDCAAAMARYRDIAHANAARCQSGKPDWQGLAIALSPENYGLVPVL